MTFEKLHPPEHSGARTVRTLILVHATTIAEIDHGKRFTREGRDVTSEIKARCEREIAQCKHAIEALKRMSAGDLARANELLNEIQEYIPRGDL